MLFAGLLQINLIAPPTYVMTTTTLEKEGGIAKLQEANDLIKTAIEKSKGTFKVKMEVSNINYNLNMSYFTTYVYLRI